MFKKVVLLLLTALFAFAFTGCELFAPKVQSGEKTITVVFDMTDYEGDIEVADGVTDYTDKVKEFELTTKAQRLETVLDELVDDKKITYSGTKGAFGIMITDVDNITLSGNQFYAIYTDDDDEYVSSTQYGTYQYEEKTLLSAIVGATMLPVKDGFIYVITISEY